MSLIRQKKIHFFMEPVNFGISMDAYLEIAIGMETISLLLPVLAHDNDGSLNRSNCREGKVKQDIWIGIERAG